MLRNAIVPFLLCASLVGCRSSGSGGASSPTPTPEPSPTPAALCEPTAGGPYWALEGETVSFTPACATGASATFVLEPVPEGAVFDGATFRWTTDLDDAATWTLAVKVEETGERVDVKVGIADRFDDPSNVPPVDPASYTEEYGVPVFFLSPAPSQQDWRPAEVVFGGRTWSAEAKKRGVTSIHYPKNSYKLRFPKEDKFDDVARGFENERRLCLTTTFDDNSYLRNRLAYELWSRMDPEHVKLRQASAVVYLDGEFWGLYAVTNCVDDNLMEDNGLAEEGNVYKATHHAANFDSAFYEGTSLQVKWGWRQGYEKVEGLPEHGQPGAYADLEELVRFVATSDDATFAAQIGDRIDVRDYADWWVFATFIRAEDSAAKNSFHYHHATSRWRYVPWDFNASFGQGYDTTRRPPRDPVNFFHRNKLFVRLHANPATRAIIEERYAAALGGPWAKEELLALVDGYAAEIRAVALRDETKWGDEYRAYAPWSTRTDFLTHEEEVAYVRAWISTRWDALAAVYRP